MEAILIFRHLSPEETTEIISRSAEGARVYLLPGLVTGLEIDYELIHDSFIKEASGELINIIKQTGDKVITSHGSSSVKNNEYKTLSTLLTVDNVPLWHYQRFRVYYLLRNEWIINRCIKHFYEGNPEIVCYVPATFILWPHESGNIKLVKDATHKGLNHTVSESRNNKTSQNTKKRLNLKAMFNYILFFKLRILISLFRSVNIKDKKNIIVDRSIRQRCRNIVTLERKWDNFNLYPLFDLDPPGQLIISEVETPKLRSSEPFTLHKYYFNGEGRKNKTIYGEWILFRGLLTIKVHKERKNLLKLFDSTFTSIAIGNEFSEKELRILRTFISLRKSSSFYILKYVCYKKFFSRYSFHNIAAIDENSPATRSILDAGKACGMKSIGIQHGNIGDSQPAYLYTVKDKEATVMTDITITWGNYWSDFLINKANYPSSSVKTAGQMRSDLIPEMLKHAVAYRNNISDSSFIVTFATQPIPDFNYRHKIAFDVFSCFASLPEAKLILKLHPAERNSINYYKKIAEEAGYPDPDIRYDIDLYELLAASDLVITCYSTVGSEAVYFAKPLIIYDPFREDLLKYVSEGVAFQATDISSLNMIVEQLINGTIAFNKEKYSEFISKYAYAIDGEATKRTLQYLQ